MIKIILTCDKCGNKHESEYSASFPGKIIISLDDHVSKYNFFYSDMVKRKFCLLCPTCIKEVGKILKESDKEKEQKVHSFLNR